MRNFLNSFMNATDTDTVYSSTDSGISIFENPNAVNSNTAQKIADVFGCVNIKANALAIMPLKIYKSVANGKAESKDHSLYELLRYSPNPRLTAYEWKKMISQDLDLRGNHYSQVVKNGLGETIAIYPLVADNMSVEFVPNSRERLYRYDGNLIPESRILHFIDIPDKKGLKGISRIEYARESLKFANNASRHGNKVFENGTTPSGAFTTGGSLGDAAFQRLKTQLEDKYTGLEKSGKPLLLEDGLKFEPISINNSDAQWLESRKLNRENIATIFGVPSAMLNDTANTAYNNLEQKWLEFQTNTILPITISIEEKIRLELLNKYEKKYLSIKFKFNSLLRVDAKTRAEYYKSMWSVGSMNPNEIRELEDMNSYEAGNEYFVQTSYSTVNNIVKETNANTN